MSHYDLLVGLSETKLNLMIQQAYDSESLKDSLFSGGESGSFTGMSYNLNWQVKTAPTLVLGAPSNDDWSQAIKEDGQTIAPQSGAFMVDISALSLKLVTVAENLDTTIPVKAICAASVNGNALSIEAKAVIVNLSNATAMDKFVISKVLIPGLLKMLNQTLSGLKIPELNFAGISLTAPVVEMKSGYLLAAFNLVKDGTPSVGDVAIPSDAFFALMSQELVQNVVNYEVQHNVQGKKFDKSGSEGAAGFSANYHAWGKIESLSVKTTSNPLKLNASADLSMSASAGIDTPLGFLSDAAGAVVDGVSTAANAVADGAKQAAETIVNPDTWNPSKW
ncbi:MAG: hypothetical protein OXE99_10005 [Cellvibrionales bacterium]|nr:hypothetical protein [Cellvibrionales bacterium]